LKNYIAGAEEYQQKLKMGLVQKSESLNPLEKARLNPKRLRQDSSGKFLYVTT
jgi:hypothetical protein